MSISKLTKGKSTTSVGSAKTTKTTKNNKDGKARPGSAPTTINNKQAGAGSELVAMVGRMVKKDKTSEGGGKDYIVAEVTEFREQLKVDIREHVVSEKYTGATKKGINFDAELFEEYYQLMTQLREHLREHGII